MRTINATITREVKAWLERTSTPQSFLAERFHLAQPQISNRLNGRVPWRLSEIDILEEIGAIDYQTFLDKTGLTDESDE